MHVLAEECDREHDGGRDDERWKFLAAAFAKRPKELEILYRRTIRYEVAFTGHLHIHIANLVRRQ